MSLRSDEKNRCWGCGQPGPTIIQASHRWHKNCWDKSIFTGACQFRIPVHATEDQVKRWERAAKKATNNGLGKLGWWCRESLNAAAVGAINVDFSTDSPRGAHGVAEKRIEIRVSAEMRRYWSSAASLAGLERSEWCRQVLDFCSEQNW